MGKKPRRPCAFYDLNLHVDALPPSQRASTIATAFQLGFSGVALNHVITGAMDHSHSCNIRALNLSDLAPPAADVAKFHQSVLGVPPGRPFRQFTRLTVIAESAIQAAALNASNPVIRSYDMVAIRPTSQKVFDQACTHLEVDVISSDFCHRLPFRLKAPSVKAAVERGIFFEVTFSGAFADSKVRRELFANAQMLQGLTRGRNIIISSGARRCVDLRGPYDIANMATLFGLSREAAKLCVSRNCEDAVLHGLARKRTYKSAITVETQPVSKVVGSSDEAWFDVPKVWDQLASSTMGDSFSFTQKTEGLSIPNPPNNFIVNGGKMQKEFGEHMQNPVSGKSEAQTGTLNGHKQNLLLDTNSNFFAVNVGETKRGRSAVSHKRKRDGGSKRENFKEKKQKKKKRLP